MELVRISTAGSVDDGKSTLIGRLLYDNNALTKEQEELIKKKTREKGWNDLDFSVITDGLVAEREQGITIDVAHIYFSTASHKFIIADSPGHVEYTRNMVTGASTAETSIILIDARKGLLEQSFRHFYISQLLKLQNVIFCINKMDLIDFNQDRFLEIAIDIKKMVSQFPDAPSFSIVPISSLKGDNVVHRSKNTDWYTGPTLNELLHTSTVSKKNSTPFRFDVQQVFHAQEDGFTDYRGYAGRVISGELSIGDRLLTLPSKKEAIVTEIRRYTSTLKEAHAGDSITISLSDEIDISRGSILVKPTEIPIHTKELNATLVWMDEKEAQIGSKWELKSGARSCLAKVNAIHEIIDPIQPEQPKDTTSIQLNDISKVSLKLNQEIYLDAYSENKKNGIFILIDPQTNNTVAIGFVNNK